MSSPKSKQMPQKEPKQEPKQMPQKEPKQEPKQMPQTEPKQKPEQKTEQDPVVSKEPENYPYLKLPRNKPTILFPISRKETGFQKVQNFKLSKFIEYCASLKKLSFTEFKLLFSEVSNQLNELKTVRLPTHDIYIKYHESTYQINYCQNTDDIFKSYTEFINSFYNHVKQFYTVNDQQINVFLEDGDTWFDTYQFSKLLGYNKANYLAKHYVENYSIATKTVKSVVYTNTAGIKEILNRGRKPECNKFLEQLELDLENKKNSHEAVILDQIIEFLDKVEYKLQYHLGQYFIDMYIPEYNIVIEVDERGHSDRDPKKELDRETYIRANLTTKILRINPNAPNFRIAKELGNLHRLMV